MLRVENPIRGSNRLQSVQARLGDLPRARTTEEIMRNAEAGGGHEGAVGTSGTVSANVEPPSPEFRAYTVGDVFRVSVPENWRQVSTGNSVRFAPEGASGAVQGRQVFTHGVEFGVAGNDSADLREATEALVQAFARTNPGLRMEGQAQRIDFAGRQGLRVVLRNSSDVTGREEAVVVTTTLLEDRNLFYSVGVAPVGEFQAYSRTLQRVNGSVQLAK
jgi:hypothetical protein